MGSALPAEAARQTIFFRCFFQLDFYSPKYPQNGQKIAPKSAKNPVKIASESHARFCIHFYIGFYRFAVCLVSLLTFRITLFIRFLRGFLTIFTESTFRLRMPLPNENERKTVSKIIENSSKILSNFN